MRTAAGETIQKARLSMETDNVEAQRLLTSYDQEQVKGLGFRV